MTDIIWGFGEESEAAKFLVSAIIIFTLCWSASWWACELVEEELYGLLTMPYSESSQDRGHQKFLLNFFPLLIFQTRSWCLCPMLRSSVRICALLLDPQARGPLCAHVREHSVTLEAQSVTRGRGGRGSDPRSPGHRLGSLCRSPPSQVSD